MRGIVQIARHDDDPGPYRRLVFTFTPYPLDGWNPAQVRVVWKYVGSDPMLAHWYGGTVEVECPSHVSNAAAATKLGRLLAKHPGLDDDPMGLLLSLGGRFARVRYDADRCDYVTDTRPLTALVLP
jgi:hypothetical protein